MPTGWPGEGGAAISPGFFLEVHKVKDRQLSAARGMAGWLTLELGVGTLTDLSRRTGRDVTTLSAGVKRLQIRSKTDLKLAEAMDSLLKVVS